MASGLINGAMVTAAHLIAEGEGKLAVRKPTVGSGLTSNTSGAGYAAAMGGAEPHSLAGGTSRDSQLHLIHFLKRGYAQRMRRGSKVLLFGAIAVLIAVNVVLLFLLFRPDGVLTARPSQQDPGDGGSPTATWPPTPDASTNPTLSTRPIESVPVKRLLLATSSKMAWRATVGDCNTPGKIERSTNVGASWKRVDRTGPAPIVRLGAEPSGDLFTIGGTRRSCSVRYMAYAGDGTVRTSNSPTNVWFPTPENRDEINGPGGTKGTPCNRHAIALASLDLSRALVMCDDGTARRTGNSGKTWQQVARIPDALTVAAGNSRYWAAGLHEDCDGVTVQSLTEKSGSLTRGRAHCAAGLAVAAGQVALDVTSDGTIWLWSGSRVVVSRDDGQTWE
jgi:hypothetical protein